MTATRPALFPSAFAPHVGGVEELTRQLALQRQRSGDSPVVVTMRWPKSLPSPDAVDGIPVLREVFRVPEPKPRFLLGWALHGRSTRLRIAADLRQRGVDLVHVQCVANNADYARAAARQLDVPLVVTMQGELTMDATAIYQRSAQQRRSWRRLLDSADAVTGCSLQVLDEAKDMYDGAWSERASVVPNGIRLADFAGATSYAHPRPYILGIGRMVAQKGFDVLIRAFAAAELPGVDLLLAGEGTELPKLRGLVGSLDLTDRVHFLGRAERPLAVSLFTGAVAFVLASRHEPQGIVVLEAMAAGAPVVAARVGGVPETVVDGINGLLFAREDHVALAGLLSRMVSDGGLRDRLRAGGTATAATRDWGSVSATYSAVYAAATRHHLASRA